MKQQNGVHQSVTLENRAGSTSVKLNNRWTTDKKILSLCGDINFIIVHLRC